jgi:hypothetical protein
MKTQTLASFVWNTWKGKPASPSRFVPVSYKRQPLVKSRVTAKTVEEETPKVRKQTTKLTDAHRQELISKTQHLDPCFATLWRRTI